MSIRCVLLALTVAAACGMPGIAASQTPGETREQGWLGSYRDVYQAMIRFEKYGKPKQLIQQHYQIVPKERGAALEGLQLTVSGKSLRLNLPLDGAGRAVFPLLKSAYDDNAELSLNRKADAYLGRPQVSIVSRADGIYDMGDLRAACEQVLAYLHYRNDGAVLGKKCIGVRFSYAKNGTDPVVQLRGLDRSVRTLAVSDGGAFQDDKLGVFRTVGVRFADGADRAQIVTQNMPVAIAALFE